MKGTRSGKITRRQFGAANAAVGLIAGMWLRPGSPVGLDNLLAKATFQPITDYESTVVDASISPDGKFVAYLSDHDGPSHVWLKQIGAGNAIDLTPGPEDQQHGGQAGGDQRPQ